MASASWSDLSFVNTADYGAYASSSSEGTLLGTVNDQPIIPALFFFNRFGKGRTIKIEASGVLSTTGTPTIIFQLRMGTTSGSATLTGASIGVTQAITTSSGVTNKRWALEATITCYTPGVGTGNTTLSGSGEVRSPGGFASPFNYPVEITTPDTATWTQTIDCSLQQYINLSATWSASSSSNTITCKQLLMHALN